MVIVLISSLFFCVQNVVVRVLFKEFTLFGMASTGGFVTPTLQHSFLLLFMRMLLVVPLMAGAASHLYPHTWQDIRRLRQERRSLLMQAIASGGLMFLYLALLYWSVGLIPTGVALTLFFTYPAFTTLFAWKWFGDRPTLFRWSIMAGVFLGSALTLPHGSATPGQAWWLGSLLGVGSGMVYALYTVMAQNSFKALHPIPFTWISFATTLLLSGGSLLLWPVHAGSLPWFALWFGGLVSAVVTATGHVLHNLGVRSIGAATASILASTNPALTVVLAWLAIQETLSLVQGVGVAIVTLSVVLLSREQTTPSH